MIESRRSCYSHYYSRCHFQSAARFSSLFVAASRTFMLFVLFVGLAFVQPAAAQDWESHTSLRQVVDLTASEDAIWTATSGGVFKYSVATGDISRFTTTEGLFGLDIRAIEYDPVNRSVWVGYQDGVLDRIDVDNLVVRPFLDIQRASQFPMRDIRNMRVTGDTLIVATGFGVVLFDVTAGEVLETYVGFGTSQSSNPVSDIAISSAPDGIRRLWVATTGKVASAPLTLSNLQDPAAWTVEEIGAGTLSVTSIAGFGNTIYAGTESGLFVRESNGTFRLMDVTDGQVNVLFQQSNLLLGIESSRFLAIESPDVARIVGTVGLRDLKNVVTGPDGKLWVGDNTEGLSSFEPVTAGASSLIFAKESFFPSGPFDGQFTQLTFDNDNNLWLGGIPGSERGFYKLDTEGNWTNYIKRFFPDLVGKPTSFRTVHADTQGNFWVGSEGGGLAQVNAEDEITFYGENNSTLGEAIAAPGTGFTIVRGIASEPDGTLWVSNTGAARPLHARLLDGSWTSFGSVGGTAITYEGIFVDSFRQKWIVTVGSNNLQRREGLLVLSTGSSLEDVSDDNFRYFSESGSNGQGLPGTVINGIAEDNSGRVWLATDEGLAYFVNTGIIAQDPNAIPIWPLRASRQAGESQFLFFGLKINDVTVDPADNLWVATDVGVYYVTEADLGFEDITHFTTENSPLLSDVVLSVAVNEVTGEVFFSTDLGLISLQGDATSPATSKQDLFIYPNPVRVTETGNPEVFIEGLLDETDISILTPTGSLVTKIEARGGRVRWDGRDLNNQLVPSGVYLVIAVDRNGDGASYGKVAVIR
ncbi:MAG: two-component regulator propeller domain-containing protein [Rhodothermales bacterium]